MSSIVVSVVVLACLLAAAALGFFLNGMLPGHHLNTESKDALKIVIGVVGTLTALVLGLVIGSAKSSYDDISAGLTQLTTDIVLLDRVLARYGPEASQSRAFLREAATRRLNALWGGSGIRRQEVGSAETTAANETLAHRLSELKPENDYQRALRSQAEALTADLARTLLNTQARVGGTVPHAFIVVLAVWLVIMFTGIGALTPGNATARTGVIACAFAFATALFLILELDTPYHGVIQISDAPVRLVLDQLAR
jgi:hypothetical protein